MSSSHHGKPDREQVRLIQKFVEQVEGRARREYPQGRLGGDDDGELALAVAADRKAKLVRIDFGKPVAWLGLGERETKALIQMLIAKLREIATEPFTLEV